MSSRRRRRHRYPVRALAEGVAVRPPRAQAVLSALRCSRSGQVVETPSSEPTPYVTPAATAATANCRSAVFQMLRPANEPIMAPRPRAAKPPMTTDATTALVPWVKNHGKRGRMAPREKAEK